jgi:undecaprenyl-diphosphatase
MSIIQALILGIIQGLTEFLPVSSSGHLELGKAVFGLELNGADSLTFDVIVHAGTALSTIFVFRKDIINILLGLLKWEWNDSWKFAVNVLISMVPAAFIGLVFQDEIEKLFQDQILLVGGMLVITGLLLFLADRAKNTHRTVTPLDAVIIGISQAIAILPGISRSGATISTSVLLGVDRERAARFSFLMVLPLIIGKSLLDVKAIFSGEIDTAGVGNVQLFIGFLAAFFAGLLACKWMIALVKRANLRWFAFYCFAVGIAAALYTLFFG